jgi:hypothetical protein
MGDQALRLASDPLRAAAPRVRELAVWAAPPGVDLAVGKRVARGIRLSTALALDGAELVAGGRRWRAHWTQGSGRLQEMRAWVVEVLGGSSSEAA